MSRRLVLCSARAGAVVVCRIPECVGRNDGIIDGCDYAIHDGCKVDYNGNGPVLESIFSTSGVSYMGTSP